ncbi:MAG: autotransporter-associated beta strand repeat-containing protein [Akkermansiaceae bacterium]
MKPTHALRAFLVGTTLLTLCTTAKAQTIWTGDGANGLWTTPENWDPSANPASGAAIQFDGSTALQLNNTLGTARTIGSLTFTADQTASVTINTVVGTPLTFNPGTIISVAAGDHKFVGTGTGSSGTSRDLLFGGAAGDTFTFDIVSGASFEIQGRVGSNASSSGFVKTGTGTLIFSGNSGGSGAWQHSLGAGFQIQNGALRFAAQTAGGNTANNYIVSSGAALELVGGFTQSIGNGTYTLNGTGIGSTGALRSISGNNTISGTGTGGVDLATNSSIGVDAASLIINQIVKGSGSLTKVGGGNLTLSGANTYTGTTIISTGTLEVQGSVATSSSITNNAALIFNSGAAQSYGNAIGGSGSLTKQGAGTLTLNATNSYTGITTISAGTLEVQGSVATSSGITNNAALIFKSGAAQSYGNAIGGSGTLTKQGAGTLTLSANNSYSGTTTISEGVLKIGNGGTTGTLGANSHTSIASGAELQIDHSTTNFGYTYTGALSGDGTVNVLSSRRFNFQNNNQNASGNLSFVVNGILGINTPSGVTSVHLGALSGSGTIQRAGATPNPPLTVPTVLTIGGKNTSSTYSGNIASVVEFAIDKVGSGTLTFAGTASHGGGTTVSAGTLLVNGSLGNSAVTVNPLAIIGGTGSMGGGLTVAANSFLKVVDLADALAVAGTVTFGSGFGIANLLGINWDDLDLNTPYTVLSTTQTFGETDTANFGPANAAAVGNTGRQAYFTNGSLAVVVIPEPRAALLGGLGLLALLRRRRS